MKIKTRPRASKKNVISLYQTLFSEVCSNLGGVIRVSPKQSGDTVRTSDPSFDDPPADEIKSIHGPHFSPPYRYSASAVHGQDCINGANYPEEKEKNQKWSNSRERGFAFAVNTFVPREEVPSTVMCRNGTERKIIVNY